MSDNVHLPKQRYYNPIVAGHLMADGVTQDGRTTWTRQGCSRTAPDVLCWVGGNAP